MMLAVLLLFVLLSSSAVNAFVSPSLPTHQRLSTPLYQSEEAFDMEELRQRIAAGPYGSFFPQQQQQQQNEQQKTTTTTASVYYIIKFEQGVHSIEYPEGSGNNVVLAFTTAEACNKFATNLRVQQFFDPMPHPILPNALADFCDARGVYWQVVPQDLELHPPTRAVENIGQHITDRNVRDRLNYLYFMVDIMEGEEEEVLHSSVESVFE